MKHLYLIGKHISHSKSPEMYNALFQHLGLDWTYELADFDTPNQAQNFIHSPAWLALNATMPYKALAFDAAHVKAASTQLAQGANVLFRRDDKIIALNTDGLGCVRFIQRAGYSFEGARVVVCGTGPTARAILAAAAQAGANRVALLGRQRERAQATINGFLQRYKELAYATLDLQPLQTGDRSFRAAFEEPHYLFGSYTTSTEEIAAADIVIDATPLGMLAGDLMPFDASLLGSQQLVFDVVYGHGTTALIAAAQQAGIAALDGHGMLVAQAVENALTLLDFEDCETNLTREDAFVLMAQAAQLAW